VSASLQLDLDLAQLGPHPLGDRDDGACRKCPEVLIETAQLGPG
jgi:hypothetical protein